MGFLEIWGRKPTLFEPKLPNLFILAAQLTSKRNFWDGFQILVAGLAVELLECLSHALLEDWPVWPRNEKNKKQNQSNFNSRVQIV